jgi:hypothetical protein
VIFHSRERAALGSWLGVPVCAQSSLLSARNTCTGTQVSVSGPRASGDRRYPARRAQDPIVSIFLVEVVRRDKTRSGITQPRQQPASAMPVPIVNVQHCSRPAPTPVSLLRYCIISSHPSSSASSSIRLRRRFTSTTEHNKPRHLFQSLVFGFVTYLPYLDKGIDRHYSRR